MTDSGSAEAPGDVRGNGHRGNGHRSIRSFVLRTGRITAAQQKAYHDNWDRWGLELADGLLDAKQSFGRAAPLVLEIGFGMGASLVEMAAAAPERNFLGVEVHRPGVGKLMHTMGQCDVDNIRVYCHDAVEVLDHCIADASLDAVQIFFPDPWHKKRHRKRRLVQPGFVQVLRRKLRPDGLLHLATDWQDYAQHMMKVLSQAEGFRNMSGSGQYSPRPASRPLTKFEKRGTRLGHDVWDLQFCRYV